MKTLSSTSSIISSTYSSLPLSSPSYPPSQCCRRRRASSSIHSLPFTGRTVQLFHSRRRSSTAKNEVQHQSAEDGHGQNTDEPLPEDIKLLTAVRSIYNDIMILETAESRLLLLDSSHKIHSIFGKGGSKWTGSYWDEFASLPRIIPAGPIAIFGLGGGTAADLMLHLWPSLQIEGWEIDEILVHKSREYLGLSELENRAEAGGGGLRVRIGDALSANASVAGGYAGIIVDLFADGKVLRGLEEVKTWAEIGEKLMPKGRIMVNCGGVSSDAREELLEGNLELGWEQNNAIRAMRKAFPGAGELNWKLMPKEKGANFLALTRALPDLAAWSSALPDELSSSVYQWRICSGS
ncbi:uncharacterized protein LOC113765220 [Coffea eugenioides]|uniref:Polyamine aminopropyl transferase n=1 Tax=Coffea arabica TaxID=13443 RepID=A0A6P6WXJ8_COFAR|nr:uncharacterized protein LOC113737112 [Coffea arabica]XP_027165117.1 uncharacterized protein LOC113765220 [Coffea eugenioides]